MLSLVRRYVKCESSEWRYWAGTGHSRPQRQSSPRVYLTPTDMFSVRLCPVSSNLLSVGKEVDNCFMTSQQFPVLVTPPPQVSRIYKVEISSKHQIILWLWNVLSCKVSERWGDKILLFSTQNQKKKTLFSSHCLEQTPAKVCLNWMKVRFFLNI